MADPGHGGPKLVFPNPMHKTLSSATWATGVSHVHEQIIRTIQRRFCLWIIFQLLCVFFALFAFILRFYFSVSFPENERVH